MSAAAAAATSLLLLLLQLVAFGIMKYKTRVYLVLNSMER